MELRGGRVSWTLGHFPLEVARRTSKTEERASMETNAAQ